MVMVIVPEVTGGDYDPYEIPDLFMHRKCTEKNRKKTVFSLSLPLRNFQSERAQSLRFFPAGAKIGHVSERVQCF